MPLRKNTGRSTSNTLRKNAVSLVFIVYGVVNLLIQALMPDAVPNAIISHIINTQPSSITFVFYTGLLYIWYYGGIISLLGGIIAIFVRYFRG